MQRWEYLTWVVGYADTTDNDMQSWQGGAIKYVNGRLVNAWREAARLPEQLAQAGREGWELVSVTFPTVQHGSSTDPLYIFKRPAE